MGMDTLAATVIWLSPAMGFTLAFVSIAVEASLICPCRRRPRRECGVGHSARQFGLCDSPERILVSTHTYRVFCFPVISQLLSSVIKGAGVVPMSISGFFKKVTAISVSAWVFGDKRTPLNIRNVGITLLHFITPQRTSSIY